MTVSASSVASDPRAKILNAAMRKAHASPDALIAILHKAQELYGFLDESVLWQIARSLRLPPSRVFGVATFYHLFRLKPQGEHTCVICLGTACFVKGAQKLIDSVEQLTQVQFGETTPNGRVSLVIARCIGACGIAPAVVLDNKTIGQVTPDELNSHVQEWMHGS